MNSSNKKLKKYAGLLNDAAPKGEFLAFINPQEAELLKKNGALGLLTDFGIPSYRGAGGYQGGSGSSSGGSRGSSGGGSSSGGGGSSSGGGGGRDSGGGGGGRDYSPPSRPSTPPSKPSKPSTPSTPPGGGGRDSGAEEAARQAAIAQEAANREAVREAARQEAARQELAREEASKSISLGTEDIMSGYDDFVSKTYGNMPYISTTDIRTFKLPDGTVKQASSTDRGRINEYLKSIGQPPVTDVNSENIIGSMPVAPPSISQAPIEVGIPDSESGFVDPLGTIYAAPEIFDINVLGDPSLRDTISENLVDPGFVRALDEQARRQADPVFGDPDPYIDTPIEERDTITSFLDNYRANVASNPFELGLIGTLKTMYQTNQAREMMRGTPGYEFLDYGSGNESTPMGGGGDRDTTTTTQPTTTTPTTTLPPSMINQYFSNMGDMGNALSSQLQTDYNNAKNSINSILGITPPSQQFGYSADPYGGLMASNLTTNPYNIDYLRRLGLI